MYLNYSGYAKILSDSLKATLIPIIACVFVLLYSHLNHVQVLCILEKIKLSLASFLTRDFFQLIITMYQREMNLSSYFKAIYKNFNIGTK
jgi:hypothetical protein